MFYKEKGSKFAERIWTLDEEQKPKSLMRLKDAPWPKQVIEKIVVIYSDSRFIDAGITDPLTQKLINSFAWQFGGKEVDGAWDLKKVNWEMLIDYFELEAVLQLDNLGFGEIGDAFNEFEDNYDTPAPGMKPIYFSND